MKKTRVIGITLVILLVIGGLAWETAEIRQCAGEYIAVDAQDSAYELNLSKIGRISVVDVGAGNPALEGWIYRSPFSTEYNRYHLITYGETDNAFLNIGEGDASVWISAIGQTYIDPAEYKVITIETETEHMQFNEKGFE